jgi:hypothetical protein
MLRNTLLILCLALTLLTIPLRADQCQEALEINHQALNQCLTVIDKKTAVIDAYQISQAERDKLLASTQADLRAEQESKTSLIRNPWFWGLVGFVAGVAITKK